MCFRAKLYDMGFRADGQETGLDPTDATGPVCDRRSDEIEGIHEQLAGAGAEIHSPFTHVSGDGWTTTLTEPDANPIALLQETA